MLNGNRTLEFFKLKLKCKLLNQNTQFYITVSFTVTVYMAKFCGYCIF